MMKRTLRILSSQRRLMFFCLLGAPLIGNSQIDFQEIREMNSIFPNEGTTETVDIDLDGDLDILVMGRNIIDGQILNVTNLLLNDGVGNFSEMENVSFDRSFGGDAAFGDVDSDGDIDIILTGQNTSNGIPMGKLYLNQGNASFIVAEPNPIPAVQDSEVEFFDYNGDQHLDLLISGSTGAVLNSQLTKILIADGQGNFEGITETGIDPLTIVDAAIGDINGDGIEEIVISGIRVIEPRDSGVHIYHKENGRYVKKKKISTLTAGEGELADFDQDGDLDYLIGGRNSLSWLVEYFLNDGMGNLTKVLDHPFLLGTRMPRLDVEDFDLDGDLDVLITGNNSVQLQNYLYINDGKGGFTINDYPFPVTPRRGAGVGNFDGKGLYDFIFFGEEIQKARIFLNNLNLNTPPLVTQIVVSGEPLVNHELNAVYLFLDKEEGEDNSSFQWYRADDASGTNRARINGADQKKYTINALEEGKYLSLEVTPNDGDLSGPVEQSEWIGPVKLPLPNMTISGNSITIINGDLETSIEDQTHIGGTINEGAISKIFTLGNDGKAELTIGEISLEGENKEDFSVVIPEVLSIVPGVAVNFTVEFSPMGLGRRTAVVSIHSNDLQNSPFTFRISGDGLNSPPIFNSMTSVEIFENTEEEIIDINSSDGEGGLEDENITYTITGGEDKDFFNIDPETGSIYFISSKDYEDPVDQNADNEYIVEVTADDGGTESNTAFQILRITVVNVDELPIAVCKEGITVPLVSGEAIINPRDIDGGSTDDMGVITMTVTPNHFTCNDIGPVTVTLTVTDNKMQSVSCTTIVTIINNSIPRITAISPILADSEAGKCSASVEITPPSVLDDCESWQAHGTRRDNLSLTDPFPIGETVIVWTSSPTEPVGEEVIQLITVIDSEAPVISPVQPIFQDNDAGSNGALIEIDTPIVSDCRSVTLTGTRKDGHDLNEIFPVGETIITWTATDGINNAVPVEQSVYVRDVEKPIIDVPLDITVISSGGNCGSFVNIKSPLVKDNCGVSTPPVGVREDMLPLEDIFPVGETRIKWTAIDINNNEANVVYQRVKVSNRQPDEIQISGPVGPQIIGAAIEMTANFTDENFVKAKWQILNGGAIVQESLETNIVPESRETSHSFENLPAGVYTVSVFLKYDCGKVVSKNYEYVVIYDPNGGFVTGGGWIHSPAGAMRDTANVTSEGKANFGFNAKYKSGKNDLDQVDGETSFQFKAGELYFKSSSHEAMSLIVSGGFKATYKGVGAINGEEGYNFMVSVIDAEETENYLTDLFRIKIWKGENVIYDNNLKNVGEDADPATSIGGGSIVIHKPKLAAKISAQEVLQLEKNETGDGLEVFSAYPNPMGSRATIEFKLTTTTSAILSLYDLNGKEILRLYDGIADQDKVYRVEVPNINFMGGIYIYRLTTGSGRIFQKQLLVK